MFECLNAFILSWIIMIYHDNHRLPPKFFVTWHHVAVQAWSAAQPGVCSMAHTSGRSPIYPVGFQKLVTICRSSGLFAKRTMNSIFGQEQPQFTCVPPKSRNVAPPILVRSCNCYFWNIVLASSNPIQIKSNQGRWIDSDWSSWHPTSDSSGLLCSSPAGAEMGQEGPIIGNHIYHPDPSVVMTILFIHMLWWYWIIFIYDMDMEVS